VRDRKAARQRRLAEDKRRIILEAAREAFAEDGLEKASLRSIAGRAGYTPAALYFHFDSKEAIYAALLRDSLSSLGTSVASAAQTQARAPDRFRAAAMAFFAYYAAHPSELDLGFYLFRGGMKPKGLNREVDKELNAALADSLMPLRDAALAMGADVVDAKLATVSLFAHAAGLLLLLHTGRIRMFDASAEELMVRYVTMYLDDLERKTRHED